jgi:hypothetical protein
LAASETKIHGGDGGLTMSETSRALWEQQPGETSRAFGAFCRYRDLGPRRSLRAAAEAFYGRTSAASERQIDKWSHAFSWVERAGAWDRHLDAEARKAQEEARREMVDRHVREARALQAKALERLRALCPDELGPADLLRYVVEAAKLERLALGEPDAVQRHELTGRGGGALHFSLEEAVAAARELEEAEHGSVQRDGSETVQDGSLEVS